MPQPKTKTVTFPGEQFDKAADALEYTRDWADMRPISLADRRICTTPTN